jgi:hypothetical protein
LEVRNRSDGHPPFTEREREIHLNGIGGVKFCERLGLIDESKPFFFSEENVQLPKFNFSMQKRFVVERWALSVERWAFRADESYTRP